MRVMRGPRTTCRCRRARTRRPGRTRRGSSTRADERLAQAAAELHARGELGDVERARLVVVELGERGQRVGGAAGGDDVGARLGVRRRERGDVAVAEPQRALALAQRDPDADRAAQLAGRAAQDRRRRPGRARAAPTKVSAEPPVGVPASVSSTTRAPSVDARRCPRRRLKTRTGMVGGVAPERPTTAALRRWRSCRGRGRRRRACRSSRCRRRRWGSRSPCRRRRPGAAARAGRSSRTGGRSPTRGRRRRRRRCRPRRPRGRRRSSRRSSRSRAAAGRRGTG